MAKNTHTQAKMLKNQEQSDTVFTPEEIALGKITEDFKIALNKKEVRALISDDPLLKSMDRNELANIKHNAQRRLKRIQEELSGNRRKSKMQQKAEKVLSKCSQSEVSSVSDKLASKDGSGSKKGGDIDRLCTQLVDQKTKHRMIDILRSTASLPDDHPLIKAVIARIVRPSQDDASELAEIYRLFDEQQASLIKDQMKLQDYDALRRTTKSVSPHSVLNAFLEVATEDESVLKNQQFISIVALTAINTAVTYPTIQGTWVRTARALIDACVAYLKDKEFVPEPGLLIFSHTMGLIDRTYFAFGENKNAQSQLQKALIKLGLTSGTAVLISKNHQKLCYSNFIDALFKINPEEQRALCNVIAKLEHAINPGNEAMEISSLLRSRVILGEELMHLSGHIDSTPQQLLESLRYLAEPRFEKESIRSILKMKPDQWMREIKHIDGALKSGRAMKTFDSDTYEKKAHDEGIKKVLVRFDDLSKKLVSECPNYTHNAFQVYAAAKLASDPRITTVGILQTGSGKSFICTLLAQYYQLKGEKVAIVTSQMYLVDQFKTMLGSLHQQFEILTIQQALLKWQSFDTLIIDECDECFLQYGVSTDKDTQEVNGFWEIIGKRCIFMTATVQTAMQEVANQLFGVKVKEFIDLGQTLQAAEPTVCRMKYDFAFMKSVDQQAEKIKEVLLMNMKQRPIIVFTDDSKTNTIVKDFCRANKLQLSLSLTDDQLPQAQITIREWDHGVCLVNRRFSRGSDLRFKEDSLVIGTYLPSNKQELIQMVGRSSRTMSNHEGVVIVIHPTLSSTSIEDHLAIVHHSKLREAIWCAKVLLGKHIVGEGDDSALIDLYKKGWQIQKYKLTKMYGVEKANEFVKEAEKWIIECSGPVGDKNI